MKIYIGYDVKNKPISMLLADNRKAAEKAWIGIDVLYAIEEVDILESDLKTFGVAFILLSEELSSIDHRYYMNGKELKVDRTKRSNTKHHWEK